MKTAISIVPLAASQATPTMAIAASSHIFSNFKADKARVRKLIRMERNERILQTFENLDMHKTDGDAKNWTNQFQREPLQLD